MSIQTVLGPIEPADLGVTLMHEHTLVDAWEWGGRLGYDSTVDDEELLVEELAFYRDAGGSALVDVTPIGLRRDPSGMRRLAQATGLHIVMGCGWYRERVYPAYIHELSTNALAEMLVKELEEGVEGGIRPGIIGEIGTERFHVTPAEEKVFRAAARAQRATGASVTTHTTHFGDLAHEQMDILMEEGVPPERIVIGHLGERRGVKGELAIAERGVYVEIDHVGRPASAGTQPEWRRARNVAELVQAGYLDRVLISMDICANSLLRWNGGHGFDYLLTTFVPLLREEGLTDEQIRVILVDNPIRVLDF
ncbi:MAG: phosphotriesterase-related protein [Candidatus Aminicenantes bacterium]|nr:phosphotriesterase-related protein [Candidatus Aminicenantes bacterium]